MIGKLKRAAPGHRGAIRQGLPTLLRSGRLAGLGIAIAISVSLAQETIPRNEARQVVGEIIQQAVKRAHMTTAGGLKITTRVHFSRSAADEVKGLGDEAVAVLSEYVDHDDPLTEEAALRLLGGFNSEAAASVLLDFSKKSSRTFIRVNAVRMLANFPLPEVAHRLENISRDDPSQDVREAALDVLRQLSEKTEHSRSD